MSDLARRIDAVVEERHRQLPAVRGYIEAIDRLDEAMRTVDTALAEAVEDPAIGDQLRPLLDELRTASPLSKVEQMRQTISVVRARYERGTVNIGVSGQARVGKSTLLQSLSGLDDAQIPAGRGRPVTAVRSRIEHSSKNLARVAFHDWASFRREVLGPYFNELGLGALPSSVDQLRTLDLDARTATRELKPRQLTILKDLHDIQKSLDSFADLLTGAEQDVDLEGIRGFVKKTYPDESTPTPSRKYLAVRNVRILCTFPSNDVRKLVLIDLPGLGEISPEAEKRHVDGLMNDTDAVVLLKRPTELASFWREEDAQALDLVERAKGDIQRTSDFMFVLKNQAPDDDRELKAALTASLTDLNEARSDDPLTILEADASDPTSAQRGVLGPLLRHLAEHLPRLDREVLNGAKARCAVDAKPLQGLLTTLDETLKTLGREGDDFHAIVERARTMRRKLAVDLEEKLRGRFHRARAELEDNRFIEQVEQIHQAIDHDLEAGFGDDREAWVRDLYESIRADGQTSPTAGREINRIRVAISRRFNELDDYFALRVAELQEELAAILVTHTGSLLEGRSGKDALETFERLAREADHPATGLAAAAGELLHLKIEYRTHLHPRVRRELDLLQLELDDPENPGQKMLAVSGEVSEDGARQVADQLAQLGRRAAWGVRKALLEQAIFPELVLHAAAEQLVDSTIRHGAHESEFQEIARAYRDNIWPGVFRGIKIRSVRIKRLRAALHDALDASSTLVGGH